MTTIMISYSNVTEREAFRLFVRELLDRILRFAENVSLTQHRDAYQYIFYSGHLLKRRQFGGGVICVSFRVDLGDTT